jgi:ceramide glucosyltransferase
MLPPIPMLLLAVLAGCLVYSVMTIVAAARYLAVRPEPLRHPTAISILKPLHGVDEGLEENLRSFFEQDYQEFEILAAVRHAADPAGPIFESLQREFPRVPSRLLITGEPPYANAKVFSLDRMVSAARHDLLVMSDSDIRVTPGMLKTVAAEFQAPGIGLSTCPYRAVAGRSLWSQLEAIGMNTEFWGGVLVARMLEGMKFAVGPTIVARKEVLHKIGGFEHLKDYLAEDFVMGKLADEAGYGVSLSSYVIEHRIGSQGLLANARHRLRWARSTRRSRPWGYIGQVFTNPLPIAMLFAWSHPAWSSALVYTLILRIASAWAVAGWVLHERLGAQRLLLIPLQDVVSFFFWLGGFFGNTITWRGHKYYLHPDGRFELK